MSHMSRLRRGHSLFVHSAHTTTRPKSRMNEQLRVISELNRVIHEPGRLMVIALLAVVKECDFLYLLHETAHRTPRFAADQRPERGLSAARHRGSPVADPRPT